MKSDGLGESEAGPEQVIVQTYKRGPVVVLGPTPNDGVCILDADPAIGGGVSDFKFWWWSAEVGGPEPLCSPDGDGGLFFTKIKFRRQDGLEEQLRNCPAFWDGDGDGGGVVKHDLDFASVIRVDDAGGNVDTKQGEPGSRSDPYVVRPRRGIATLTKLSFEGQLTERDPRFDGSALSGSEDHVLEGPHVVAGRVGSAPRGRFGARLCLIKVDGGEIGHRMGKEVEYEGKVQRGHVFYLSGGRCRGPG